MLLLLTLGIHFSPRRVLQKCSVDVLLRQLHVSYDRPSKIWRHWNYARQHKLDKVECSLNRENTDGVLRPPPMTSVPSVMGEEGAMDVHQPILARVNYGLSFTLTDRVWCLSVYYSLSPLFMAALTYPRIKQFFTDIMWGYFSGSTTEIFNNFIFRNWSTDCSSPSMLWSVLIIK